MGGRISNRVLFDATDPNFADLLQYRFQRPPPKPGYYEDVYDGLVYCNYSDFFQHKFNVSFALNYDGAPKFKSSGLQIWPVQLHLNELPPHIRKIDEHLTFKLKRITCERIFHHRCSREYIFIAGIWCSPTKPPTASFFKPLINTLNSLDAEGLWYIFTIIARALHCNPELPCCDYV